MNYNEIIANLKKRIFHPVYLLTGDEPYYIDAIADFIEEKILPGNEREFNQLVVYGRDTNLQAIISNCKRYPMMASHFVIVVREAQELDNYEGLEQYLEKPLASTILVFCHKYKKFDGRTKLAKRIKELGVFFDSPKIYDNKIPDWIVNYLKERSFNITPKASMLLTEFLGNNLGKIVNELEKMLINLRPGTLIDEVIIEENIGLSKDFNVFELQKAIGQKNILKANMIVRYFAANLKENPLLKVIPILNQYFLKLMIIHQLADKSPKSVASAIGVHSFLAGEYFEASRKLSFEKLRGIISILHEYDLRIKGINNESTPEGELMREMLYKIMH
jgi:DNA polymerase III subunit delta